MIFKRLSTLLLSFTLCIVSPVSVMASSIVSPGAVSFQESDTSADLPEPDYDDPDYLKRLHKKKVVNNRAYGDMLSPFTKQFYTYADRFDKSRVVNGIDVSKWQGTIDWEKVKAAGVDFAFIRCGYTAVNDPFRMYADPYFDKNIKAAHAAGLKVGVYYFSNAKTLSEVKKETSKTLELIEPYKNLITLPVVYDYEAFTDDYRAYGTPKDRVTDNARYFLRQMKLAGYDPMYYGCSDVLGKTLDTSRLTDYKCWLAHYTSKTDYKGDYDFWQYAETGRVNGIATDVDCNFYYDTGEYGFVRPNLYTDKVSGFRMSTRTKSWIILHWNVLERADGYQIYRSKAYEGDYKKVATIRDASVTKFKDTTVAVSDGREYHYRIVPYMKQDGKVLYGNPSDILTAGTKKIYKTKIKSTTDLGIRQYPGVNHKKLGVLPEGTSVKVLAYTYASNGAKWYRIQYKDVTGYVSGSYVKQLLYGKARTKTAIKSGAGSTYKTRYVLPKQQSVLLIKTRTDKTGKKWGYVRFEKSGKPQYGWMLYDKFTQV